MIGHRELSIEDYKNILRRRKWLLIIPAVLLSILGYVTSLILPARYTSETVVLVQAPVVSPDIVKPILGEDINQRLATMREEILSRTRLQKIIEKFDLYREDIGHRPMEDLVARLRDSIEVSAVSPMDRTRANGLPGFTIDVTARQPLLAQQVCSEITSMFLRENVVVSERQAEDTTDFIDKQLQDAKAKLDSQDAKLAAFQRQYMGSLPDESQSNFSMLTGLSARLDSVTQSISQAQQDKLLVETSLSQQIAAAKLVQTGPNPDTLAQQLSALQGQLAALRVRYTENYPDVIKLKGELAELQQRVQKDELDNQKTRESNQPGLPVETPQVQQLRVQLQQLDATIKSSVAEQARLQQEIKRVQAKLELTPAVAQQYKALTRDYQTALGIYNDFLKKQSDSEVSRDLLRRQQGEQFQVLDPPSLPQEPTFPKRRTFALGGIVGGLGIGVALVFFLETQDTTLRTDKDVEQLLKLPTLASIPLAVPRKGNSETGCAMKDEPVREEQVDQKVGA